MSEAAQKPRLRQQLLNRLRRFVSGATARETLSAFVVPGPDVARALGLDLESAGLAISPTPRHASVLVLVGELPDDLKTAAAVAHSQMPRPRTMLAVGTEDLAPLPDISVPLEQESLAQAVAEARSLLAEKILDPGREDPAEHKNANHDNGDHDREETDEDPEEGSEDHMDHGEMDFMSMVAMTEGTPRSSDGLQMEWVEAPFGPLFPGLPGGLALTLTLDGDTVAKSDASSVVGIADLEGLSVPAETFADWLASLDPLSPVAHRVLALRAFDAAADAAPDERAALARIGALERERAASHLGWLASFGYLTGHARLAKRAGELQLALLRSAGGADEASKLAKLKVETSKLIGSLQHNPLLTRRLKDVGETPRNADATGPVARARGLAADTRADDEGYRSLGFEAVVGGGGDALARLRARLEEIEHSMDLALSAGSLRVPKHSFDYDLSGEGAATIETPRGKASLRLSLEDGVVSDLELCTPSTQHIKLVGAVTEQRELADALVGVASLDISPWGVIW